MICYKVEIVSKYMKVVWLMTICMYIQMLPYTIIPYAFIMVELACIFRIVS